VLGQSVENPRERDRRLAPVLAAAHDGPVTSGFGRADRARVKDSRRTLPSRSGRGSRGVERPAYKRARARMSDGNAALPATSSATYRWSRSEKMRRQVGGPAAATEVSGTRRARRHLEIGKLANSEADRLRVGPFVDAVEASSRRDERADARRRTFAAIISSSKSACDRARSRDTRGPTTALAVELERVSRSRSAAPRARSVAARLLGVGQPMSKRLDGTCGSASRL